MTTKPLRRVVSIILILSFLPSCASVQQVAGSEELFVACKTADVVTTAVGINSGKFVEANPLLKPFIGPHNFVPLIAFSFAMWGFLHWLQDREANTVVNLLTCGVAGNNAKLMLLK